MATSLRTYRVRTVLCVVASLIAACGGRTGYYGEETAEPGSDEATGGSPSYTGTGGATPQAGSKGWHYATGGTSMWATGGKSGVWATGGTAYTYGGSKAYTTGGKTYASGGASMPATGGKTFASGGATMPATGGKAFATGGATMPATGGKAFASGGATMPATGGKAIASGGATFPATGGNGFSSGGLPATGGSGTVSCAAVICPAIPTTCRQIVQDPGACCPTCLDSGCPTCAAIACPTGSHAEVVAGDCCASCVADPPDACVVGQQSYASMRASMLEKYGSLGCSNSTDCVIIPENNACALTCGIVTPSRMSTSFQDSLDTNAKSYCSMCKPPLAVPCVSMLPACVNGKCIAVSSL